ncbi:MAG: tetratricopeptide repeat protein [Crocinitomicaceae bacterium]
MKKIITTITLAFLVIFNAVSQQEKSYLDKRGKKQLCGPFELEALTTDTTYSDWFEKNYNDYQVQLDTAVWIQNLSNTTVDIYIGTWCGDSRTWVPRFVKFWEELGLDKSQLNFIGLYNGIEKYKQGPNGEEKGKRIHHVPTFIFTEAGNEIGRIVENPHTSLLTDVAQIALGYPSAANYKGASYLFELIDTVSLDTIYANYKYYLNTVYRMVYGSGELNGLGYVLLRSNRMKEAELTFRMNTRYFPNDPNVYDSYGEVLAKLGKKEEAIKQYQKVLKLSPDDKNALAQLKILKGKRKRKAS